MTKQDIFNTISKALEDYHGFENVKGEDHLINDLGLDSLEKMELVMLIERDLNIEIKDVSINKIYIIDEVVDFIHENYG